MLANFVEGIKEECGCELNVDKCKMYSKNEGACEEAQRAGYIPEELARTPLGGITRELGRGCSTRPDHLQYRNGGGEVCYGEVTGEGMTCGEDNGGICGGPTRRISSEVMDDAAVLFATSHHILAEDMHTGGDGRNGSTRGILHHGGGTSR